MARARRFFVLWPSTNRVAAPHLYNFHVVAVGIVSFIRQVVMACRLTIIIFAFAVTALLGRPDPPAENPDEKLLKTANIGSDGPALLNYFRQRTVSEKERIR